MKILIHISAMLHSCEGFCGVLRAYHWNVVVQTWAWYVTLRCRAVVVLFNMGGVVANQKYQLVQRFHTHTDTYTHRDKRLIDGYNQL